ncbi:MAG: CAP domain-containing protein, partial [Actinocatenispora sp.]
GDTTHQAESQFTERREVTGRASRSGDRSTGSPSPAPSHRSPSAHPSPAQPSPDRTSAAPGPSVESTPADPEGSTAHKYAHQVVDLVNEERTKAGCPAMRNDDRLADAAVKHSKDMAQRGYFDHNTPEGVTPWDRIKAEDYQQPSAENIAAGQPTPEAVVEAWMNSSGHRANILNCSSRATGVGFYHGGSYQYYWTQDFGYN